jgi:hypothetical protein
LPCPVENLSDFAHAPFLTTGGVGKKREIRHARCR